LDSPSQSQPQIEARFAPRSDESIDEELASLPGPPRRERRATLVLMAVTALASLAMVASLVGDAAFAFAGAGAIDLGDLRTTPAGELAANSYVRGEAMLGGAGAIRFEHPFESDWYRLAPVAGRPDVWVELRVPEKVSSDRFVPPTSFAGRLVRFDGAGPRHRGLASSVADLTSTRVPEGAWLLVDGEAPGHARWAVALVALFAAFAAWNAITILRLVRRVK
jgi:hypothetical protein